MSTTHAADMAQPRARMLESKGARLELLETSADSVDFLRAAVCRLSERECTSLLVEGGPTLQAAFWRAGLVDRIELFVTPWIAGPAGPEWNVAPIGAIAGLDDRSAVPLGDDVVIQGYVHRAD